MVWFEIGSDFTELAVIEQLPPPALAVTLKVGVTILAAAPHTLLNVTVSTNG
jgi:hypothetical protein